MKDQGFSAAELMVVVAFIGLLGTLGYPYFMNYLQTASLRAAAQELAAVIAGARQLAIARNNNVCVLVSSNGAVYRTNTSATCAGGTTFVGAGTKEDGTIPLANKMQVTGTTANVVFTNLGAASVAGAYTVKNPVNNLTMSVVVSASGRVTIQ